MPIANYVSTFELINIEEFTHNVVKDDTTHTVTGDGVFDILMETATKHLLAQYEANRIRGENYATAYVQVYIETLKAALRVWIEKGAQELQAQLLEKQIELADKNLDLADKQIELQEKQIEAEAMKASLYKRQIEGYDENYKEKILKILLDAYTVVFSVAQEGFEGGIPKLITVSGINDICDIITKDLNKPATNNESDATWVEKIRNDTTLTVPNSYSTAGWDENA